MKAAIYKFFRSLGSLSVKGSRGSPPDRSSPPDWSSPRDQSSPPDWSSPRDQSSPPDRSSPQDQSSPPDRSSPPDSSSPPDWSSPPRDENSPRNESMPQDQSSPPDSSSPPDCEPCWICLETAGHLTQPCGCPRKVHASCMARWQLQRAGKLEEKACRFCGQDLPEWQPLMVPEGVVPSADVIMAITFNHQLFRIKVAPGPEGRREFEQNIRGLLPLEAGETLEFSFNCKHPLTDALIHLEGEETYNAAYHCAAVAAARRLQGL